MTKHIKKRRVITISGGKDSTAVALLALNNYSKEEIDFVFCDTGWEAKETYEYLEYLEIKLGITIIVVKSKKYKNFEDLVAKKGRFPANQSRFCTVELKVKPFIDWVLDQEENLFIEQGIRWAESDARKNLNVIDDYFTGYYQPTGYTKKGKAKFNTYRKKEVKERQNQYITGVYRPIYKWTTIEVFEYLKKNSIKPNPLYGKGFTRVGCFPCIGCKKSEIRNIAKNFPERITEIERMEEEYDSTFFKPDYIPERYCSKEVVSYKMPKSVMDLSEEELLFDLPAASEEKIKTIKRVPTIRDVAGYLGVSQGDQYDLFPVTAKSCDSVLVYCE